MRKLYIIEYGNIKETTRDFKHALEIERRIKEIHADYKFYWINSKI